MVVRKSTRLLGWIGFVALAVLMLQMSFVGRAHEFTADSEVTIRWAQGVTAFKGQVISARASCEQDRRVLLYKVRPGADSLIGTDRTNDEGRWRIDRANPHGSFYAKIFRREVQGYGHFHVCRGDKSQTIQVQ